MELTRQKLSDMLLYTLANTEKAVKQVVNESCNGISLGLFEDKALLADKDTGKIYFSDYHFDGKTVKFENFEPVDIVKDEALNEAISNYFESDGYDTAKLVESYEQVNDTSKDDLREAIVEGLSKKSEDIPDYTQLLGINEEIDIKDSTFFKNYKEHLAEAPTSTLKVFTWDKPLAVSLIDEDENFKFMVGSKEKAEKLIKTKEFKAGFLDAIKSLKEDTEKMTDFLMENKSVLALDENELKELVGVTVVGDKDLMKSRKEIATKITNLVKENEDLNGFKTILEDEEDKAPEESEKEDKLAVSDKDIDDLKKALDKALESITDEKLVSKINSLKDALDSSKDAGETDVSTVKECVELLSF